MKITLVILDKRGKKATQNVIATLKTLQSGKNSCFGIATSENSEIGESLQELQATIKDSPVALGYAASTAFPRDEPEIIRLENATILYDGTTYAPTQNILPLEFFTKRSRNRWPQVAEAFVKEIEGDFSLVVAHPEGLVAARDPIGVQPLFYGENESVAAFASNRKALWQLGIAEPKCFPPGNVATVTSKGFGFKAVKTLTYQEPTRTSLNEAAQNVEKLLESSVRKRLFGVKKAAVAFSGGLDSSVVAFLAKKCDFEIQLIHVSLEDQPETKEACKAAEELQLPLKVHLFKESDVERIVPEVVELVEEPDPVKISIGIPFYWTAQKAAEAGLKVLLAGQGADELFGGYQRYVNEYIAEGEGRVRETMYRDVVNIHENNIERDEKICIAHDVVSRACSLLLRLRTILRTGETI